MCLHLLPCPPATPASALLLQHKHAKHVLPQGLCTCWALCHFPLVPGTLLPPPSHITISRKPPLTPTYQTAPSPWPALNPFTLGVSLHGIYHHPTCFVFIYCLIVSVPGGPAPWTWFYLLYPQSLEQGLAHSKCSINRVELGNSLAVRWLGLRAFTAEGTG